ncbi:MAG: rod shape-determining protein MreC [Oscillospiraceae bacterium]|nr:rod shape-determining protein MreC [Oscillospiraceae bacterium]
MKIKDFLKIRAVKISLSAVCCFTCLIIAGAVSGNYFIATTFSAIIYPFQQLRVNLSEIFVSLIPTSQTDEYYQKIIRSQQEELNKIRNKLVDYDDIKRENIQYEKYYELKKSDNSLKFVSASVIGKDADEKFHGFFINKGSIDGVSKDDPVVTSEGLVGYVSRCGATSSVVKTIFSPEARIPVIAKEGNYGGVVVGSLKLSDEKLTRMMFLLDKCDFPKDTFIVTSGVAGKFPKNLLVGKTKEFENDKNDGSRYVVIEPFVNIDSVIDVFVIVGFLGKGQIT